MKEEILEAVSEVTGIPVAHIKSKSVVREAVEARGIFCVVASMAGIPTRNLCESINKTPSSVISLSKKYFELCKINNDLIEKRDKVIEMIGNEMEVQNVMEEPLWTKDFKIIDVSSRYFGKCYIGVVDGSPAIQEKSFFHLVNRMLDQNAISKKKLG